MNDARKTILAWLGTAEERVRAGNGSREEMLGILAELRDVEFVEAPHLPADVTGVPDESAALRIKAHLLRARLEMSHEQAEQPLPLARLMTLLNELAGHFSEMDGILKPVWAVWLQYSRSNALREPTGASLAGAMRGALLEDGLAPLRSAFSQQRRAAQFCLVFQGALKKAGAEFAREVAAEFNPAAIASVARARNPQARPEDFWRRYEEQADRLTPSEVERRFTRLLVSAIEELFQQMHSSDS
jgi:hypothetical protein